jgi:8-oxo-dGTP pyrophosphatase MutT (NUDIX family)
MVEAAVAVIRAREFPENPEPKYLVLRRTENPADPWSGHFAFPGGRREATDTDLFAACIRETLEECGIALSRADLARELPRIEAGNALGRPVPVAPYLFDLASIPAVRLDAAECSAFHWIPETDLRDATRQDIITPLPGLNRSFPAIRLGDGHIWGFTYRVLAEILELPR